MPENRWKEIWSRRTADYSILDNASDKMGVWRELKRADGFDVSLGENADEYYEKFYRMWKENYRTIVAHVPEVESLFEVGCGAGASLYLYKNKGIEVGGIDYSEQCVSIANRVLGDGIVQCMDALDFSTSRQYDVVLSDSVFVYFKDEEYAMHVLKKMYEKAKHAVLITEIYDAEYEEECISYRRSMIKDYDIRYEGLDKLFINKCVFETFAKENGCRIEISGIDNEFYWNSNYMYNVLLVKEEG